MNEKELMDNVYGTEREYSLHTPIEKTLGYKLELVSGYDLFDYISKTEKVVVELKSRRVYFGQYYDMFIGKEKIDHATQLIKNGWKIYFFYQFLDGLYYTKFRDTRRYKLKMGGRKDRGRDERKYCYAIPIKFFSKSII